MAEIQWTAQQRAAIEDRDGSLLVSAAAGSGKTAVLVERLLRRIEEEHESLSRFLMITYTKAAASELRAKIGKALGKRIAQNPQNLRLVREFNQLHNARIQTVHAFCTSLLHTHGYLMDLPASFRVMDETEGDHLCRALLDDLLEDWYAAEEPWFLTLIEALGDVRGDQRMIQTILTLLKKSRSHPFPDRWLSEISQPAAAENWLTTPWGEILRDHAKDILLQDISILEHCLGTLMSPELHAAYSPMYQSDLEQLDEILQALDANDWDTAYDRVHSFAFARLATIRNPADPVLKKRVTDFRDKVKEDLKQFKTRIFTAKTGEILDDQAQVLPVAQSLVRAVQELSQSFQTEKLRRSSLDYSDLEHFAIHLLVERFEDGIVTPTPLARALSEDFCEIMVDEYQDSNAVQDLIFRAISRNEQNIVMVGDLKQSIYRFRLADPTIFLEKHKTFADKEQAAPGMPRKVSLNANFRSRNEVIHSVNFYFDLLMSEKLGDIDYDESQALRTGRSFPPTESDYQTELLAVDLAEDPNPDEELSASAAEAEARVIARKIHSMIAEGFRVTDGGDTRPAEYRDFVILMRALSQKGEVYLRVLQEEGIPCSSDKQTGLLGTVEVGVMISLLTVIDNPLQDVPLAGILRSPLFGFSADDLAALRMADRYACYFDALQIAAKQDTPLAEKVRTFLALLHDLRDFAREFSCARLIWECFRKTHAFGLIGAMPEGKRRVQNLILFYQHALSHGGNLSAFLRHLAHLSESGEQLSGYAEESGNTVRLMTIHKSKGLEFPVVILASCGRRFNRMDLSEQVLIHPKLGLGLRARNPAYKAEWPTAQRTAIQIALDNEMKSEEMRLLYVAMTRPIDKLILTLSRKDVQRTMDNIKEHDFADAHGINASVLRREIELTKWALAPALFGSAIGRLRLETCPVPERGHAAQRITQALPAKEIGIDFDKQFSYAYPHPKAIDQPSKATATGLSAKEDFFAPTFDLPELFRDTGSLTATQRGTVIHLAMQLVDFAACTSLEGCEKELIRLKALGHFSDAEFAVIDPNLIYRFFTSELGLRAKRAAMLRRESRFSVLLPAPGLPEETILLQGVIDLYFEEPDGLVIVDFKSDKSSVGAKEKYTAQLEAYAAALTELTGKPIKETALFFLATGETVCC